MLNAVDHPPHSVASRRYDQSGAPGWVGASIDLHRPRIFNEEMVKIFGGVWVFLCHEAEIPKPFDFKTTRSADVRRSLPGRVMARFVRCSTVALTAPAPVCLAEMWQRQAFHLPVSRLDV